MKRIHLPLALCCLLAGVTCGGRADRQTSGAPDASAPASPLRAVPHEKLAELLPILSGWTRESDPRGDTDAAANVSRVHVDYQQDGGTGGIGVEIMDVASNLNMIGPLKALLKSTAAKTDANGTTQKVITVGGHIATEEWTPEAGNGTVSVLVGDRFVVTVTGATVANVGVIHKVIESIDVNKIAALK
jgi:hypothetical protein